MMAGHILLTALALLTAYALKNAPIIVARPVRPERRRHRVRDPGRLPAGVHLHAADRRLHRRFPTPRALGETKKCTTLLVAAQQAGELKAGLSVDRCRHRLRRRGHRPRHRHRHRGRQRHHRDGPPARDGRARSGPRCSSVSRSPRRSPCSVSSSSSSRRARGRRARSGTRTGRRGRRGGEGEEPDPPGEAKRSSGPSIAFVIVFALLAWKAWPAIKKALQDREDKIRGDLEQAESVRRPRPRPRSPTTSASWPRRATRPGGSSRRPASRPSRCART